MIIVGSVEEVTILLRLSLSSKIALYNSTRSGKRSRFAVSGQAVKLGKESQKSVSVNMQSNRSMTGEVYKLFPLSSGKIAYLVGNFCLINCTINDITVQALWDTGAQVSFVNEVCWKETFPSVRSLMEVINNSVRSLMEVINKKLTVFFLQMEQAFNPVDGSSVRSLLDNRLSPPHF